VSDKSSVPLPFGSEQLDTAQLEVSYIIFLLPGSFLPPGRDSKVDSFKLNGATLENK
jgi:hypothetical protein